MKISTDKLGLVLVFLLCGCGANQNIPRPTTALPAPSPAPTPAAPSMTQGNWELDTTSSAGLAVLTIGGNIIPSGASLSAAVHVSGSTCFDPMTTIALTGSVSSSGDVQLNSATVAGQVIALDGTINYDKLTGEYDTLTGTYSITGGCADGDHGTVIGNAIWALLVDNILSGTLTSSSEHAFDISGNIAQNAAVNPNGSYGISGTVTFTGSCVSSGTLTPGSFQSGSFVLGTSVGFQIKTDNGTLLFSGQLNQAAGELNGNYTLSGGTCDQTGTAALALSNRWDY